jgi:hypothetical protein
MKKMRKPLGWCAFSIFWGLGAFLLWRLWNYQKSLPDPLGSYIEFTVMFLATFYVLALFPIKHWVNRFCSLFDLWVVNNQSF